jgi:hypothetical protein
MNGTAKLSANPDDLGLGDGDLVVAYGVGEDGLARYVIGTRATAASLTPSTENRTFSTWSMRRRVSLCGAPLRSRLEGRGEIQGLRTRTSNRLRHEVPDSRAGDQRLLPRARRRVRRAPKTSTAKVQKYVLREREWPGP